MRFLTLITAGLLAGATTMQAQAKSPSDAERLRQQAEHLCYDDVQKLCKDAVPDEDKVKACMGTHHADLSPACAKVYDQGIGGG